ncbi:unnamed protein product [Rotaria sordida]|uniref:Uncharacterized protein n=1 Tax=Rotaria sordida TaxID=392033 RepID=A0A813SX69_9BILA|nr:unnamed protein product [Rotaria sordida]CAF0779006.1 unnamed protein product [Rotaria sordida]CAF0803856.1 unnamed protein product [Rotaria sordida]CAF3667096.1 unnamed protein product [Rotaria sordida]CAF3958620.1 unnamed protein product [Rotaria sordida]
MGYANVQYTILYYQYRDLSFQSFPFMGYPLQTDWISLPILHSFTNGFFSGIFWNLLEFNATENILKMAIDLTLPLAPVANVTDTHDVGFVIMSSYGHGYHLLKFPEYLQIIITAAMSLSSRYSPTVRCTRSWDSKEGFLVIIDNMMNLELLFEASKQTNNQTWYNMAWQHANRTMYEHFRPDNSTYHVVEYNETDGSVIRKYTAQGYADWSTWSRGQAWAVHGFTIAYRYTKYQPFLDKAIGAANYFLSHLSSSTDLIPYWDFDAPHHSTINYQPRDTSAAAIFASGLVELSQYVIVPETKDYFLTSAKSIVDQLTSSTYLILGNKDYVLRAVIANGTQGPYPEKPYDVATVFGDYYLTQTILRLFKL